MFVLSRYIFVLMLLSLMTYALLSVYLSLFLIYFLHIFSLSLPFIVFFLESSYRVVIVSPSLISLNLLLKEWCHIAFFLDYFLACVTESIYSVHNISVTSVSSTIHHSLYFVHHSFNTFFMCIFFFHSWPPSSNDCKNPASL